MTSPKIVVCSFYTADDYYREHGERLRANLERLGVELEVREIEKQAGEDWAAICRKKVPFLAEMCLKYPDHKVFWMDVDCILLDLPDYIANSTADIIGFQRGYGSPTSIGYEKRTRFWEPSIWGVNSTPQARKMIADAAAIELNYEGAATDDYFMEEAWRANCDVLTFQFVPSNAVVGKGIPVANARPAFFKFGSSGNVDEFKGKVVQHTTTVKGLRKRALRFAKNLEKRMPANTSRRLRLIADSFGITNILVSNRMNPAELARRTGLKEITRTSQSGEATKYHKLVADFSQQYLATQLETDTITSSRAFLHYSARPQKKKPVQLAWWTQPNPGNFGDWLSPLIVGNYTDRRLILQPPVKIAVKEHMMGLGSIGRFIKANSVVVGTGISSDDLQLSKSAKYVSLRGPITARVVAASGGPTVTSFGDPGVLMSRVMPVERGATNGRVALVRHFTHRAIPLVLRDDMDELEVLMSHPDDIRDLVVALNQYDHVVTSAMHVFISCQSYGVPCALVTFEGFEDAVHGNGIKYTDYAEGAGLDPVSPVSVGLDLNKVDIDKIVRHDKVSEAKKDEVEKAILDGLALL
jgi:hypothetical protein